jgi:kynurenine 3-monooxygenase
VAALKFPIAALKMASFSDRGDVVLIGAGLVGSLLAYIFQEKGYSVSIFERFGDIRHIPSLGRSINLVITSRGLRACDAIGGGLREELLSLAVAVVGRVIHQQDGSVQFQRYGKDDTECNYSISRCYLTRLIFLKPIIIDKLLLSRVPICRYELNKFLIGKAEEAGAKFYFGHSLVSTETDFGDNDVNKGGDVGSTLAFEVTEVDGTKTNRYVHCACPVFACDGGGSRARYALREKGLTEFTETLLNSDV